MEIKSSEYYWNKFFKERIIKAILIALIPLSLIFTDIFMYAKISLVILIIIPLFFILRMIYSPYKIFVNSLSIPPKIIKVNIFKKIVPFEGKNSEPYYEVQFCDDPNLTIYKCEFDYIRNMNLIEIECYLFDDGKSNSVTLINENETIFVIVRIPDRPVNFLDSTM